MFAITQKEGDAAPRCQWHSLTPHHAADPTLFSRSQAWASTRPWKNASTVCRATASSPTRVSIDSNYTHAQTTPDSCLTTQFRSCLCADAYHASSRNSATRTAFVLCKRLAMPLLIGDARVFCRCCSTSRLPLRRRSCAPPARLCSVWLAASDDARLPCAATRRAAPMPRLASRRASRASRRAPAAPAYVRATAAAGQRARRWTSRTARQRLC